MSKPNADEVARLNRYFAIECNNQFWSLSERELKPDEKHEILAVAFTSLYHWSQVGTDENINLAYLGVARALCINESSQSLEYAQRAHSYFDGESADWIQAFTNVVLSHALLNAGKKAESVEYYEKAVSLQSKLSEGDRKVFDATFTRIPVPHL